MKIKKTCFVFFRELKGTHNEKQS